MKCAKWTDEEKEILRQKFPTTSHKLLCKELNRSPRAIRHYAYILKLRKVIQPIRQLSLYEKGFIEAALDGEGTIGLYKEKTEKVRRGFCWRVRCQISNTNKLWLEKIKRIIGAGHIGKDYRHRENHHQCYTLYLSANVTRQLLPQIKLVIKEKRRVLTIEALHLLKEHTSSNTSHDATLKEIFHEMRQ